VVLVMLGCGFVEVGVRRGTRSRGLGSQAWGVLSAAIPAAGGSVLGSAVPLAQGLEEPWQVAVLVVAAVALFVLRRGVVTTLVGAGAIVAVA
ncbi:MAG: hypothetical protein ACR2NB_11165, partial [Solirubrobacteraceae bacterium]